MGTYCNKYRLNVTYLDCMECDEDKTNCKTKQKEGGNIHARYLSVIPKQEVYMVFASKKEGYTDNVIFRAKVTSCNITLDNRDRETIIYTAKILQCVTNKELDLSSYIQHFCFHNSNVNTGMRIVGSTNCYPVFTEKEKCLQWLKQK